MGFCGVSEGERVSFGVLVATWKRLGCDRGVAAALFPLQ